MSLYHNYKPIKLLYSIGARIFSKISKIKITKSNETYLQPFQRTYNFIYFPVRFFDDPSWTDSKIIIQTYPFLKFMSVQRSLLEGLWINFELVRYRVSRILDPDCQNTRTCLTAINYFVHFHFRDRSFICCSIWFNRSRSSVTLECDDRNNKSSLLQLRTINHICDRSHENVVYKASY